MRVCSKLAHRDWPSQLGSLPWKSPSRSGKGNKAQTCLDVSERASPQTDPVHEVKCAWRLTRNQATHRHMLVEASQHQSKRLVIRALIPLFHIVKSLPCLVLLIIMLKHVSSLQAQAYCRRLVHN